MTKNIILLVALFLTLALPFLLRPAREAVSRADEVLVIITPHNEAIRHEFAAGFRAWYLERTGRTVGIDWRTIGGTSEITRYLEGEYTAGFRNLWTNQMGRRWSALVQEGFVSHRLTEESAAEAWEAREAFLASNVSCGIDLFFGGGAYDFMVQARAGRIVDSGLLEARPEWFNDEVIPIQHAGDDFYDPEGRWIGVVLSAFGIIYNQDSLARLGLSKPERWRDLADPRYLGEVALADPTKSGSMNKAFENLVQEEIHRVVAVRLAGAEGLRAEERAQLEADAVAEGWMEGLRLLQRIGANARYFTDSAQKVPIDVASGNCAAGMCIDFYGRQQQEALLRRSGSARVNYVSPPGGTAYSVDPIALLRGAPNPVVASAFIEYVASLEGQRLWNLRPGTEGGPEQFALRRLPVRKDLYDLPGYQDLVSDPEERPYEIEAPLVYRAEWTGHLFNELRFIIKVMSLDTHRDLVQAWRAIIDAGMPAEAIAILEDLRVVDYLVAQGEIRDALRSRNKLDSVRMARELGTHFRNQYREAAAVARRAGAVAEAGAR